MNRLKMFQGAFSEYRERQLCDTVLAPTKLKGRDFEATLLPSHELLADRRDKLESAKAVGSLTTNGGKLSGLLSLPADAVAPILTALVAERFTFIVMTGERLKYRKALVHYYSTEAELDPDDYPTVAG